MLWISSSNFRSNSWPDWESGRSLNPGPGPGQIGECRPDSRGPSQEHGPGAVPWQACCGLIWDDHDLGTFRRAGGPRAWAQAPDAAHHATSLSRTAPTGTAQIGEIGDFAYAPDARIRSSTWWESSTWSSPCAQASRPFRGVPVAPCWCEPRRSAAAWSMDRTDDCNCPCLFSKAWRYPLF